jgi:uncharacterized membrane protein YgcG
MASFFSQKLPTALGNSLGSVSTKVQEGMTSVKEKFSGAGPFRKLSAGPDSITTAVAKSTVKKSEMGTLDSAGVDAVFEASRLEAEDAFTFNAVTNEEMLQALVASGEPNVAAADLKRSNPVIDDSHKIRLVQINSPAISVIFRVMPEVFESRTMEYEAVAPPQAPTAFQKYKGTSSVQWTVNATLTCRTTDEATENLDIMNRLRGWSMPYFGVNTAAKYPGLIGAPPPVLRLSGFRQQMIGPVPVVMTSLNWTFPQDVDYIPARSVEGVPNIPFPTVMKVTIQLVESFSTDEFNGFDLEEFFTGRMDKAWYPMRIGSATGQRQSSAASTGGGGAAIPEEAQAAAPNALTSAGAGGAVAAAVGQLQGYTAPSTELVKLPPVATRPFVSGGGGDFGGGGATGSWDPVADRVRGGT